MTARPERRALRSILCSFGALRWRRVAPRRRRMALCTRHYRQSILDALVHEGCAAIEAETICKADGTGARRIRTDRKKRPIRLTPAWPPVISQAWLNYFDH